MALVPVTVYGNPFTSSEVTFLMGIANASYTDGDLLIGNNSGGLSVATLTQGSGITITNGNGTITIASTGGGGFSKLTTSTTPNGIISLFVFPSAISQPSFLVVEGVWYETVSETGVTNWTWNQGTTTATLMMPAPNSNIFAIV